MVHASAISVAAAALLAALPVQAGLYSKSSPVLQIDAKNYDRLIAQSNYTSIVEFYAPWCGHCKTLQPTYEKAAKSLAGLAKVGAVDCDEDSNKAFCGGFGVSGFPTLKIVKPGKTPGKPVVEDYDGPRTAKAIVETVVDKIPNYVKRVDDKTLESWLAEANNTAKAILFSDKGKTSALLKVVAIEFKSSINVAQIRNTAKEKASLELFGITKFPTLLLLPGGAEAQGVVYEGELTKDGIVKFLSQAAAPNPDPAPAKVKLPKSKSKDSKKASKAKESFESASSSHASAEGTAAAAASVTEEVLEEQPTESPSPKVDAEKPIVLPDPAPAIPILTSEEDLQKQCLGPKSGTCILALLPSSPNEIAAKIVGSLSEIAHRHKIHKRNLFPFFVVPQNNAGYAMIKKSLHLGDNVEVVALNARRGWWRRLPSSKSALSDHEASEGPVEDWVDSIRLGEGAKQKLPPGLIPEQPEEKKEPEEKAEEEKPIVIQEIKVDEEKLADAHDEL